MARTRPISWPPELSETQLEELTLLATTYALSHGLCYLPPAATQPAAPTSTIHAPLALLPSPIPRHLFELARELQRTYNLLYARVATDARFLDEVMGEETGAGRVDDFTGNLWRRWRRVRDEGIVQPLQLGLFRSDYLLHAPASDEPVTLKQVEFNTISSSFGALSEKTAGLHEYLYKATGYFGSSPHLKAENFPPNHTIAGLVEGMVEAHKAYGVPDARILFVVQPGERNVFDQRWLEYELLENHSIHVIRQTLEQLTTSASVDPTTRALHITHPPAHGPAEIALVYLRAGYTPTDYPTPAHYDVRLAFERSRALVCPTLALQLAGGKKVQEVLARPGVLERFLGDRPSAELARLRASWMGMWGLDEDGAGLGAGGHRESAGVRRARECALGLVLKPQREGGGNNVYKEAIPAFLDGLAPEERAAWIAMELIAAPEGLGNYLVRAGGGTGGAVKAEVVSELGVFGWALFSTKDKVVREKQVGWLLRTKGTDSNEGGVAAGFSVLDSVLLVD